MSDIFWHYIRKSHEDRDYISKAPCNTLFLSLSLVVNVYTKGIKNSILII